VQASVRVMFSGPRRQRWHLLVRGAPEAAGQILLELEDFSGRQASPILLVQNVQILGDAPQLLDRACSQFRGSGVVLQIGRYVGSPVGFRGRNLGQRILCEKHRYHHSHRVR